MTWDELRSFPRPMWWHHLFTRRWVFQDQIQSKHGDNVYWFKDNDKYRPATSLNILEVIKFWWLIKENRKLSELVERIFNLEI